MLRIYHAFVFLKKNKRIKVQINAIGPDITVQGINYTKNAVTQYLFEIDRIRGRRAMIFPLSGSLKLAQITNHINDPDYFDYAGYPICSFSLKFFRDLLYQIWRINLFFKACLQ